MTKSRTTHLSKSTTAMAKIRMRVTRMSLTTAQGRNNSTAFYGEGGDKLKLGQPIWIYTEEEPIEWRMYFGNGTDTIATLVAGGNYLVDFKILQTVDQARVFGDDQLHDEILAEQLARIAADNEKVDKTTQILTPNGTGLSGGATLEGDVTLTVNAFRSIRIEESNLLQLWGDAGDEMHTALYVYGTDASGVKGWVPLDTNYINGLSAMIDAAVAAAVSGAWHVAGNYDASVGTWPTTGTGSGGAVRSGDVYKVTTAGTLGGRLYDIGDNFYAVVDAPGQTNSNWSPFEHNTEQSTETVRGTAAVATQAEAQDDTTGNDTDIVTPRKWWYAWTHGLSLPAFASAVRAVRLNGLSLVTDQEIVSGDTIIQAFGYLQAQITNHKNNTSNPHSVTKAQVGLGSVPNTDATARANHTGSQLASTISDFADTVRATVLTGLSLSTSQAVAATDTVLQAIGYLQAQITNKVRYQVWFYTNANNDITLTNQIAGDNLLLGSTRHILPHDLGSYTQVRFKINKQGVAGAANSKLVLKYKTGTVSGVVGNYSDIGTSEVSCALTGTNTIVSTSWIDLAAGAKANDILVAVVATGGDGVQDPVVGFIMAEFK